jgi:hypothetical protein
MPQPLIAAVILAASKGIGSSGGGGSGGGGGGGGASSSRSRRSPAQGLSGSPGKAVLAGALPVASSAPEKRVRGGGSAAAPASAAAAAGAAALQGSSGAQELGWQAKAVLPQSSEGIPALDGMIISL